VVKIFDFGFDERDTPFMVMEFLEGESLESVLVRERQLPPDRAFRIGMQVASALDRCHTVSVIHRDLKPDNILLVRSDNADFVKIIDFGVARVPSADKTAMDMLIGTPQYMPPEQILHEAMDGRVDIYALAVILYECLAGRPPIEASNPMEYLHRNLELPPTPLRTYLPEIPMALNDLLLQMLAKNPAERPATMADVSWRLREIGVRHGWVAEDTGRHRIVTPTGDQQFLSDTTISEDLELSPPMDRLKPIYSEDDVDMSWSSETPVPRVLPAGHHPAYRPAATGPDPDWAQLARRDSVSQAAVGSMLAAAQPGAAGSRVLHLAPAEMFLGESDYDRDHSARGPDGHAATTARNFAVTEPVASPFGLNHVSSASTEVPTVVAVPDRGLAYGPVPRLEVVDDPDPHVETAYVLAPVPVALPAVGSPAVASTESPASLASPRQATGFGPSTVDRPPASAMVVGLICGLIGLGVGALVMWLVMR
jgi:hypothetical protein